MGARRQRLSPISRPSASRAPLHLAPHLHLAPLHISRHDILRYDCGVFMCKTADYMSRGTSLTFSQVRSTPTRPTPTRSARPLAHNVVPARAPFRSMTCRTSAAASWQRSTTAR